MIGRIAIVVAGIGVLSGATFFAYRATVLEASPPLAITQTDIRRIDSEAFRLVARAHLSEDAAFALYERLARLEAAYLTRLQERGVLEGSIAPLAEQVLCDALPEECIYLWKTFDDYRAHADPVVRADTDTVLRTDAGAGEAATAHAPAAFVLEEEESQYDAMMAERTAQQARAALIWYAGEGTRRTPGILLDLVSGYLALDTNRSVLAFAQMRADILSRAYRVYRAAEAQSNAYVSPQENERAFPSSLAALRAATKLLRPQLHAQGQKDLDAELLEAQDALWWSGAYYDYALKDALSETMFVP
ncbi:hypothetical protein A3C89_03940 [Candidatus Kaiserbacteria bacterium RIFCSPHIGHO2_02_FULL_50_50]|uniref:Uncharacterized protein n=1 Tax=Candidatus Kaiserbacteria bacterium RIFCSPHIGHO2_02_FULL_50_50 TaxID=1798492 RepID=A0A1F6DFD0_9BACT|nr:MAG: hypothetical protein A3C89_03940 [Candidatus Kaiserbacteria bacterium RIFCSPHIGHO2_02_FULL_50_50]